MTDTLKALATALDRLATLEAIVARIDRLETLLAELGDSVATTDSKLDRLSDRVGMMNSEEDLEDSVGAILDRKLDRVLESAIEDALSGREITVTL